MDDSSTGTLSQEWRGSLTLLSRVRPLVRGYDRFPRSPGRRVSLLACARQMAAIPGAAILWMISYVEPGGSKPFPTPSAMQIPQNPTRIPSRAMRRRILSRRSGVLGLDPGPRGIRSDSSLSYQNEGCGDLHAHRSGNDALAFALPRRRPSGSRDWPIFSCAYCATEALSRAIRWGPGRDRGSARARRCAKSALASSECTAPSPPLSRLS
jgi:hypothetical protein